MPDHAEAAAKLGKILLARGDTVEALELLEPLQGDFRAAGLAARARLGESNGAPPDERARPGVRRMGRRATTRRPWRRSRRRSSPAEESERRDLIRQAMVGIFAELGADHELAREHRRRLAATLN